MNLIKLPEVISKTTLKKSSIYSLMLKGEFPKNIKLGERAVAWNSDQIDEWILKKVKQSTH